jgi:hypothetical protein
MLCPLQSLVCGRRKIKLNLEQKFTCANPSVEIANKRPRCMYFNMVYWWGKYITTSRNDRNDWKKMTIATSV